MNYKLKLDKVFSEYIRLRDSKEYAHKAFVCISCGHLKPFSQADCGHYINRQHMSTRYDEMNCNAQCSHCNRFDEGNIVGYRAGLVRKYSEERVLLLESRKNSTRKYSDFEYKELIKYYSGLIKTMKNESNL